MLLLWVLGAIDLKISGTLAENEQLFDLKFHQNDYQVEYEWAETIRFNKRYTREYQIVPFKFNRSCSAINLTIHYHIDVLNELEVIVQAYKFVSNEYRIFHAIRFEVNFCHAFAKNYGGLQRAFNCGNFTGCPLLKERRYHICNFVPDTSRLPPLIPSGRYKLEFQALYREEEMWVTNVFAKVHRKFDKK